VFLNYVFNTWQLEKVYIEVAEYNFSYMSGLNRLFVEEGRLRSHLYLAGRRWDLIILAVYKSLFIADETHMVDDIAMDSISAGSKRSSHLSA
jgi:RimJ/RimL family protein N-acetyltransferase